MTLEVLIGNAVIVLIIVGLATVASGWRKL